MFRIAQEAVINALRHARPQQIRLNLHYKLNNLHLSIKDDGIGIPCLPKAYDGLGLRIMKYRAGLVGGVLQIDPAEEGGTIVIFTLTLPRSNNDDRK